ncbi:MAG TPA: hypothetical protein VEK08_00460 [Planctomycetota bacterium]|nr:hypothetical protein [Planctomycetota bacterium]
MSLDNAKANRGNPLQRWTSGDPLSADRLNEMVDSINDEGVGIDGARQRNGHGPVRMRQFTIVSVEPDYLVCREWDGVEEYGQVLVAKPYLLRNAITARNGVSYTYTNTQTRTAVQSSITETQVVIPRYVEGDIIYAARGIQGGMGMPEDVSHDIRWIDLNVDGRAWAKQ